MAKVGSEPKRQVEIQLGHMCNNRCTFCVSGQRTEMREALPMAARPLLERVRDARKRGHEKITLLGGEPTLQPAFLGVVRECVRLGFSEIVIFTNGAKTARASFIDEVIETGGNFTWRISIQGGTKEAHEETTRKKGSFGRILRTLAHLKERNQKITVNTCVVQTNGASLSRFAEILLPFGVSQLHLDMVRPLDAGERSEEELQAMLPTYADLAEPLRKLRETLPADFDLNIGNLPFCVAPDLASIIHHDGEFTETIAIDGDDQLSEPWDKYAVKARDKTKPESCAGCVFSDACSGVFETYQRLRGTGEFEAVNGVQLSALWRVSAEELESRLQAKVHRLLDRAPFGELRWTALNLEPPHRAELVLHAKNEQATVWLTPDRGGYHFAPGQEPNDEWIEGLGKLMHALRES